METETNKKFSWMNLVQALLQGIIAALAAISTASCSSSIGQWI